MILYQDSFNRADGAPGADWAQSGGGTDFAIVSNELTCSTSAARSIATVAGTTHADIANVKVTWKRASGSGYDAGVYVRGSFGGLTSNTGSGYIINPFNSQIDIIRRINGSNAPVGSRTGLTLADGDIYGVQIVGTAGTVTFKLFQAGSQLGADITDVHADRIVAPGRTGIFVFQAGSMTDDFLVEDVTAVAIDAGVHAMGMSGHTATLSQQTHGYDIGKMYRYPSPLLRM